MILFLQRFFRGVPYGQNARAPCPFFRKIDLTEENKVCYNIGMETAILQFFESIRNPALDVVFAAFSFLGEAVTVAAAVALVYWLAPRRAGELILFTSLTSLPLNVFVKESVLRPRPYAAGVVEKLHIDNALVSTADLGDNLPSGHAQATSAALFSASFARPPKRRWVWAVSVPVVLLVMCSRLYLGVHYPTDVLAGAAIGLLLSLFWAIVFQKAYGCRHMILLGFAALALLPLFFRASDDMVQAAGLLTGAALFLPLTELVKPREPQGWKRLLRIPAGILPAAGVFALSLLLPDGYGYQLLTYVLVIGGASLGAQSLFRLLKI